MTTVHWIISLIIIVANMAAILSAPFEGFYFPDKFEKFKDYDPAQLNRQLIFDHDYHVDNHRLYNQQQQREMSINPEGFDHSDEERDAPLNGDQDNDSSENAGSTSDNNTDHLDSHNNWGLGNSGDGNGDFNWQNGDNDQSNNALLKDYPAVANTVCESRCNHDVTNQYNPVCGSDGLTYYNSGRLNCAQVCGKPVKFVRMGSCASALLLNN